MVEEKHEGKIGLNIFVVEIIKYKEEICSQCLWLCFFYCI